MFKTLFGKTIQRTGLVRALRSESLEPRHMMAGDTYLPYHNDLIPEDTNRDFNLTALDALLVINALNNGQAGQLDSSGVGKADGPSIDVNGDNNLSALDALRIINRLNGEGEVGDLIGFTYQLTDLNGIELPGNTASVGQLVQLRTYAQDLRLDAQGVFTAFLDIDYSDASKFELNIGEVQSFKFMFNNLQASPTSNFKFTFGNQSTGAVSLFNGTSFRGASAFAALMQAELEKLPNIGVGNVLVREDAAARASDQTAGILRRNFDIIFVNEMAGKDVALIGIDGSGVVMQPAQTLDATLVDKFPASASSEGAVTAAFRFSDDFTTGRTAQIGTNQFDEVGATGSTTPPADPTVPQLLFIATLRTKAAGTVTFTPNQAEDTPAHDSLLLGSNLPIDVALIDYGTPFQLIVAAGVVANADSFPVVEDAANAAFTVTANDTLISGTSFAVTAVGTPSNGGTVSVASGTQVNYRPAANFFGTETFTYTITSNLGVTSTAIVTMTVSAVNDPITVPNQTVTTNLGKAVTRTAAELTVGGSVGPGEAGTQTLSVASAASPSANGGVVLLQAGAVTYTPAAGFSGTDTFTIVVTDNGQTNGANDFKTQTVTVTATVVNDAPNAVDDPSETVDEETPGTLNVLANDTAGANDVNDSLTITAVGGTPTGTVTIAANGKSISYTPAAGFVGIDTFTYTVRDTGGLTDTATVTVEVQATTLPRARVDVASAIEDSTTPVPIDVLDNDRTNPGAVPTLISFTQAANGTVALNNNGTPDDLSDDTLTYVPNANFSGRDTFTYVMNEDPNTASQGASTGTVTVNVADVNDPPILANDTLTTLEDTVLTITSTTLFSNDSPGVGETGSQTLTLDAVQALTPANGTFIVSGANIIFTPAKDFVGDYVFTYAAVDNGVPPISGLATVTVTVTALNDAPVAGNDSDSTAEDTAKTITALALLTNDRPGPTTAIDEVNQTLSIVGVSATSTSGGTVTLGAGGTSVVYAPASNFNGTDTFTYTVRDTGSPTAEVTATVTMTVTAVNDSPIAGPDAVGTSKGLSITISPTTLLANDSPGPANESGQTLSITAVSGGVNGTAALVGGQIVFTPTANFTGAASFQYTVTDNGQTNGANDFKTASGTVNVTVQDFAPSTISGMVYVDETNDGVKQSAERTLGGIVVTVSGTALGQPVNRSYITLANGSYNFQDLAPGTYTISIVNPTMMIDGKDTAGTLGDLDGIANNNSFLVTIGSPGGLALSGYNFGVVGVADGYASILERLASRYYAAGSTLASNGLYATLSPSGAQKWFAQLNGYNGILFSEVSMNTAGTEVVLTIVDAAHNVRTTTLGKGKFLTMIDGSGNTIVRVLGGVEQFQFTTISLAAPPVRSTNGFLDAIDSIFAQEGW